MLHLPHDMHLGTLAPVPSSCESSEVSPGDFLEAGFPKSAIYPEEYILEAVPDPSELPQGKPRCITLLHLSPLTHELCLRIKVRC